MSRYFDSTYAGVKVAWDKINDYLYYYSSFKLVSEKCFVFVFLILTWINWISKTNRM